MKRKIALLLTGIMTAGSAGRLQRRRDLREVPQILRRKQKRMQRIRAEKRHQRMVLH